jgi:hypothetical protein
MSSLFYHFLTVRFSHNFKTNLYPSKLKNWVSAVLASMLFVYLKSAIFIFEYWPISDKQKSWPQLCRKPNFQFTWVYFQSRSYSDEKKTQ